MHMVSTQKYEEMQQQTKSDLFSNSEHFLEKSVEEHNGKNVLAIKRRFVVIRQTLFCGSACSAMNLPIIALPLLASFVFQVNNNFNICLNSFLPKIFKAKKFKQI